MPEQDDLRRDETVEQPSSGLLLSVEPLTQEGSNTSYRLADDTDATDTSDSDGTDSDGSDTSDSDGTDAGDSDADGTDASDADGTDTGVDADGSKPLGIGDSDTTDTSRDTDGRDAG